MLVVFIKTEDMNFQHWPLFPTFDEEEDEEKDEY